MKILLYSLLHTHYKLLNNLIPLLPYVDDVLVVDNTPTLQRQPITEFKTFVPCNVNESFGASVYQSSKFISEEYNYILWCSQDVVPGKMFAEHMHNMLNRLRKTNPGVLGCGLSGSVMSKYFVPQQRSLKTYEPLVIREPLLNELKTVQWDLLETIFLFIRRDVFKIWAEDIQTMDRGEHTEEFLVASAFLKKSAFDVYSHNVLEHKRELTRSDKGEQVAPEYLHMVMDNCEKFIVQYGGNPEQLKLNCIDTDQSYYNILWNAIADVLERLRDH